jgi:DNA-binding transcriptional regulator GbsR (MarR family)
MMDDVVLTANEETVLKAMYLSTAPLTFELLVEQTGLTRLEVQDAIRGLVTLRFIAPGPPSRRMR